eukprot:g3725.t1
MKTFDCIMVYVLGLLSLFVVAVTSNKAIHPGNRYLLQVPSGQSSVVSRYSKVYQDISTQLRAAILNAELDTAIALLVVSKDVEGLAAGLRYPPDKAAEYNIVTPQRINDPDVIAIKALAGASLRLSNCSWKSSLIDDPRSSNPQVLGVLKIAHVATLAITPKSGVFPDHVNKFELQISFIEAFADRMLMKQIMIDDPTLSDLNHRRSLKVVGSPVNSWICGKCYPTKFCKKRCWWCRK